MSLNHQMKQIGERARKAAASLAEIPTSAKNEALCEMAHALIERQAYILEANTQDISDARDARAASATLDRLMLNESRIESMADALRRVAALPDPVGEVTKGWRRPNGLQIQQIRVPLGVIGFIFESRPNVSADAAGLCLKSGNAVILRGGSVAIRSNIAITNVLATAADHAGIPEYSLQVIESTDRDVARQLMQMNEFVDVLIPRGGPSLIEAVTEHATIPILYHGAGICHVYVDSDADLDMAEKIVMNAKVQRPSVCNAMETLLVHKGVAPMFLPEICKRLSNAKVELRGCEHSLEIVPSMNPATVEDWDTEYLSLVLSIKVVESLADAINHINRHGTKLADAIVTNDLQNSRAFCQKVDSASVFVNASTRFTDGGEFGLGAEIGISTQKLHARGPLGLEALTTTKYIVHGDGHVR